MRRLIELKASDKLLGKRAASAFGENDNLRAQIVSRLEVALLLAALVHAFVVGAHANHAPRFEQKLGAGESGEDGDTSFLHLAAKPLHELVDGDDVVAVIAHRRRRDGELEFAGAGQEVNRFFHNRRVERRFLLEAGKQFAHGAWIEQRTGEAMRADVTRLLQQIDVLFGKRRFRVPGVVFVNQLRKPQSTRHAGGTSADDDDIGFHHRTLERRAVAYEIRSCVCLS